MNPHNPLRIAAWSGPRNISTALMRSWENRPDTVVCDEPLYAHYLNVTGLNHPDREEVIAHHESDWEKVVDGLCGDVHAPVFYQKHMAHHLLPEIGRDWLLRMTNIFLIRDPREMITSLTKTIPNPTINETGLPQQFELFEHVHRETGSIPLVLDSRDVLEHPRTMLMNVCDVLKIPFYDEMLAWPAGSRESDGIWAPHWYASVEASTGFKEWQPKEEAVPDTLESMVVECTSIYEQLAAHRLQP
jgi:hypothetical protein